MPSELRQGDLSLREKLAAALQGDSKPGSIRERLVHGIVGGTGRQDGMPLADFSPMGIVFAGDEGSRALNAGKYGDAAGAMAGLIPGAGKGAKIAAEALEKSTPGLIQKASDLLSTHRGSTEKVIADIMDNFPKVTMEEAESAVSHAVTEGGGLGKYAEQNRNLRPSMRQSLERNARDVNSPERKAAINEHMDELAGNAELNAEDRLAAARPGSKKELDAEDMLGTIRDRKPATLHPSNEGAASRRGPEELDSSRKNAILKNFNDNFEIGMEAGRQNNHINELAGGDLDKAHFIKNAMQDEGGNVPEDVAMTLAEHLNERPETGHLQRVFDQLGLNPREVQNEDLIKALHENMSIPEMLSMHYDLDPEKFKGVYGPAGMNRPKGKPTQ